MIRTLSLAPEYILDGKWTTMVDESTLNLTVILHGITQTRCIVVHKATDNAVITLNNISCRFFRSFTIVSSQSCPESTARINQHILGENKTGHPQTKTLDRQLHQPPQPRSPPQQLILALQAQRALQPPLSQPPPLIRS